MHKKHFSDKTLHKKMKFSIKDFFSKCDHLLIWSADLVTFTEEILNGKLHFLCGEILPSKIVVSIVSSIV